MLKRTLWILLSMLIAGVMFTSCSKENPTEPKTNAQSEEIRAVKEDTRVSLTVNPTSLDFGIVQVGTSKVYYFTVSGNSLPYDVKITGFLGIVFSKYSNTGWSSSLTLPRTGVDLPSTKVYVRFSPPAGQTYNGNIRVESGMTVKFIAVTGTGGVEPTGVTVNPSTVSSIIGQTVQLTATVQPANAYDKSITWTSTNSTVATVSATGLVTAKAAGTASIKATTINGKTAYCSFSVSNPVVHVTGVTVTPTTATLVIGQTLQLAHTIIPSNATNQSVTWSSSSTATTVNSTGLVTAVTTGSTVVTVKTVDGNYTASCFINIMDLPMLLNYSVKPEKSTWQSYSEINLMALDNSDYLTSLKLWIDNPVTSNQRICYKFKLGDPSWSAIYFNGSEPIIHDGYAYNDNCGIALWFENTPANIKVLYRMQYTLQIRLKTMQVIRKTVISDWFENGAELASKSPAELGINTASVLDYYTSVNTIQIKTVKM